MKKFILPIIISVSLLLLAVGVFGLFRGFLGSKVQTASDIINVDIAKAECRSKLINMDTKMEEYAMIYSNFTNKVKELTANAKNSNEATKSINESALKMIYNKDQDKDVSQKVAQQEREFNNIITALPQIQQYQGADQQLYKDISNEIKTSRNKLEGTSSQMLSMKADFKKFIDKKTNYLPNDGGSQIINVYQYNGCIPTARGTNNIDDAMKWVDSKYFVPTSKEAKEVLESKEDKPVIQ
ncbi:MAG: hypothetical protein ACRCXZ_02905 [Patescibacteria group bacterium]